MEYRLYYSPGACSLAPHIVLEEIEEPYELELVYAGPRGRSMAATDEWGAINPKRRIPALQGVPGSSGGAPALLTEAAAILLYLAARYPESRLVPEDPAGLARCSEWLNWVSAEVHAMAFGQILRPERFSDDEQTHESIRAKGRSTLGEHYEYIESLFSDGREWAVPQHYTIVDPYLLVFFQWGQRMGIEMRKSYPNWSRMIDQLNHRPAAIRAFEQEGIQAL